MYGSEEKRTRNFGWKPHRKETRGHIRAGENIKMGLRETGSNTWAEFIWLN
jgi:hypothetical protein